jgi:RimJ/RimL family protein N-acetyltransferase
MNTLRAGPLTLEPQRASHAVEMFRVLSDPAIYEFENQPPRSEAWLHRRFKDLESRRSPDSSEQWLNWVVRLPSGDLAGYVQATITGGRRAFIAYELASRHWRKGIGSLAVAAVLEELERTYGVGSFVAILKTANFRSHALLARLGFSAALPPGAPPVAGKSDETVLYKPAGTLADA